jgi:L-lactate utilization protein LutB
MQKKIYINAYQWYKQLKELQGGIKISSWFSASVKLLRTQCQCLKCGSWYEKCMGRSSWSQLVNAIKAEMKEARDQHANANLTSNFKLNIV